MPKWLFIGSTGRMTEYVLRRLLERGIRPDHALLAAPRAWWTQPLDLPVRPDRAHVLTRLEDAGVPWTGISSRAELGRLHASSKGFRFGVCACFPWRLPRALLDATQSGVFNIHPSILPRFRGPDPIFWQFHAGCLELGVSVHRMTSRMDAGPLAGQGHWRHREGDSEQAVLDKMSNHAAELVEKLIHDLAHERLHEHPQNEASARLDPWPRPEDYVLSPDWGVRHAFNFVRALTDRGQAMSVNTETGLVPIGEVLGYRVDKPWTPPPAPHGAIPFRNGWLLHDPRWAGRRRVKLH